MRRAKKAGLTGLLLWLLAVPALLHASSVRHMNLDALTDNAGLIFRGIVTSVEPGTVSIGGTEMPTTTYRFRASEIFKGEPTITKDGEQFIAVTMVGSVKEPQENDGFARFNRFRDIPQLQKGAEFLLFTTVESAYGLSVTVGLQQGCFDIDGGMALNRAGNVGLFTQTRYAGTSSGPIAYDELADRIRATLETRQQGGTQ